VLITFLKKTMNYINEIKKMDFNLSNPWEFDDFIYSGVKDLLSEQEYDDLANFYYEEFMKLWHCGEVLANGEFLALSKHPLIAENAIIRNSYKRMAAQEKLHIKMLGEIRSIMHGVDKSKAEAEVPTTDYTNFDLCEMGMQMFISEGTLACVLDMWYERSNNPTKKMILKKVIDDESDHLSHQVEIMREFKSETAKEIVDKFIKRTKLKRYPLLEQLTEKLKFHENSQILLKSAYSGEWAQEYSRKILETHFPACDALGSGIDFPKFDEMTKISF
jgi:rubrerythrin